MVPPDFGGMGLGAVEMAIITEEFGRIGFSGLALTLHGQRTLLKLGTPAQQQKYVPGLTRGELLSAIVVSEPDVGSSLKHMKTTAKPETAIITSSMASNTTSRSARRRPSTSHSQ